jgi:hypothetical protein
MQITKILEEMLECVSKEKFPQDVRVLTAKNCLRYLIQQELCDKDRAEPADEHRRAWGKLRDLMILDSLKPFLYNKFVLQDLAAHYGEASASSHYKKSTKSLMRRR